MIELTDTHCHIHFTDYEHDPEATIIAAVEANVTRMICVGTTLEDSRLGIAFVQDKPHCWASIGLHPHEARHYAQDVDTLSTFSELVTQPKVIAVGECGLDYYYNHSPRDAQIQVLEYQLDVAVRYSLPVIFHVREAFADFWSILDNFTGLKGVIHSFTATTKELEEIMARELYVGLNGIVTFTKDERQLAAAKAVPLNKLLLETDAPFLTPSPFRGTICQPKHVRVTAEFLANLRGESLDEIANASTNNARTLFGL